ncbi:unnamed protein product, partial [Didymodactylos carnosus]
MRSREPTDAPSNDRWLCEICTYLNSPGDFKCDVCGQGQRLTRLQPYTRFNKDNDEHNMPIKEPPDAAREPWSKLYSKQDEKPEDFVNNQLLEKKTSDVYPSLASRERDETGWSCSKCKSKNSSEVDV